MSYVVAFFIWTIGGGLAIGVLALVNAALLALLGLIKPIKSIATLVGAVGDMLCALAFASLPFVVAFALWRGVALWPVVHG